MDHTLENALIAGALLSIIIIPFWIITRRAKKQRQITLAARLTDLANSINCSIMQPDLLDTKAIGLDEDKGLIFFVDTYEEGNQVIDLANAASCMLLKRMDRSAINSVQLCIKDKHEKLLHSLLFYKRFADNENHLSKVVKIAEKWRLLIERSINDHRPNLAGSVSAGG